MLRVQSVRVLLWDVRAAARESTGKGFRDVMISITA